MGNHYHLLINTPRGNLDIGMRYLNSMYAQKFNKTRKKDGPVFRDRYKSVVVQDQRYLLNLTRYIHRNPVEAQLITSPEKYEWSSCQDFISSEGRLPWLSLELANLHGDYLAYVNQPIKEKLRDVYLKKQTPRFL